MSAITYDKIKITSPWEIQSINELSIKKTLNDHAELHLRSIISESTAAKVGLQETTQDSIKVYTEDGEEKAWIFKGRLKDVNVSFEAGMYTLTAWFLSETTMLDRERKSRSFQDMNLTYSDIVQQVLNDYPEKSFELTVSQETIDGPIIQYQETDWQFIKRLASYQETVIVPDVILDNQIFSYGYPTGSSKTLPDDIAYASGKDIKTYYTDHVYNPNLIENEYAYFEVESYDKLTIGDAVTFQNYQMYVGEVTIEIRQGLLVYIAKLVRQMTLRQNPIYNEKIQGASLQGTVLALQNQEIKLHLAIDQDQEEETAYWYPFVPPTVDMLYLMPQIGTTASLYIPGEKEQKAIITGCVRTNGESCEQTSDPNTRYLATEYGQELKLAPGGIYLTAGNDELILTFDDEEGVTISSHRGMVLEAKEELTFESQTKVVIEAASQILMATPTGGLSMETEIHFSDMKTVIECTDEGELPLVEQKLDIKIAASGINGSAITSAALGTVAKRSDNTYMGYMTGRIAETTVSPSTYSEVVKQRGEQVEPLHFEYDGDRAYLARTEPKSLESDYYNGSADAYAITGTAEGKAAIDKEGIEVKAIMGAAVAHTSVKGQLGNKDYGISAKAEGNVGKAEAEASFQMKLIEDSNKRITSNVGFKLGAMANLVDGAVGGGFYLFGYEVQVVLEGYAGAVGGYAELGVINNKLKARAKLAALFGGGLALEIGKK